VLSADWAGLAAELSNLLDQLETPPRSLAGRTRCLTLDRPRIMGVVNVTPDSFSDGGRFFSRERAAEGADHLDIGGERTRPGALRLTAQEQLDRVVPVVEALQRETDLPLSVDTTKASVAIVAVKAGAEFINDISGLRFDPEMPAAAAASGAGVFLMHTRGRPEEMQRNTSYRDLMGEVVEYLRDSLAMAVTAGIQVEKLSVDPGIGFGKSAEGNLEILRRLRELAVLGRPILLGTSRKSFIGRLLGQPDPAQRLAGTLATVALGVAGGAHIFRVHDVRAAREAALVAWAVCSRSFPQSDAPFLPVVGS
jgi:dihydropteroate synthase